MKKGIKIRRATEADLGHLEPLLQELIGDPDGDRALAYRDALDHDEYVAFVAVHDGAIVGFVDMWLLPDAGHGATLGYLTSLVVLRAKRRGGIGSGLVEAVLETGRKRGAAEVHVTTKMENEPAKRLYKSLGFTKEFTTLEITMCPPHGPGPC